MTTIAVAVVTKTIDGLSEAGRAALDALVRLVRRKLGGDEASREVLVHAESEPASDIRRRALAEELARVTANDPLFAQELTGLWARLDADPAVIAPGSVFNTVSGNVDGNVVQARDIQGGVSFGRS
jgi:hypothetical protein